MSRFIYYNRVKGGKYLKESRLFKIVYYILENGRITAPELAEKFEVSVRTIYRDIDVISSAVIPAKNVLIDESFAERMKHAGEICWI